MPFLRLIRDFAISPAVAPKLATQADLARGSSGAGAVGVIASADMLAGISWPERGAVHGDKAVAYAGESRRRHYGR